jgi:predicted flavoprotein YhiN
MKKFIVIFVYIAAIFMAGYCGLKLTNHQPTNTGIIRSGNTYQTILSDKITFYLEWSTYTSVPMETVKAINSSVEKVYYETGDSNLAVRTIIKEFQKYNISYKDITGELIVN